MSEARLSAIDQVIVDAIRGGAEIIERDGWTKGDLHAPTGEHCALGALDAWLTEHTRHGTALEYLRLREQVQQVVNLHVQDTTRYSNVARFNDATRTTYAGQVTRKLREAAAWYERTRLAQVMGSLTEVEAALKAEAKAEKKAAKAERREQRKIKRKARRWGRSPVTWPAEEQVTDKAEERV